MDYYKKTRWTPRLRSDTEKKINKELKKNYVTSLGIESATSCVAFGYSNYIAINHKEKVIKNSKKKIDLRGIRTRDFLRCRRIVLALSHGYEL